MLEADKLDQLYQRSIKHRKAHGAGCSIYPSPHAVLWSTIASAMSASTVLEIGCGLGYGAACLSRLDGGRTVETIEHDPQHVELARRELDRLGLTRTVRILAGTAEDILPALEGPYDVVIEDAGINYETYLPELVRLTRAGGVLIVSNLVGRVSGASQLPKDALTIMRPRPFD